MGGGETVCIFSIVSPNIPPLQKRSSTKSALISKK